MGRGEVGGMFDEGKREKGIFYSRRGHRWYTISGQCIYIYIYRSRNYYSTYCILYTESNIIPLKNVSSQNVPPLL
jgi:hypothetical protein